MLVSFLGGDVFVGYLGSRREGLTSGFCQSRLGARAAPQGPSHVLGASTTQHHRTRTAAKSSRDAHRSLGNGTCGLERFNSYVRAAWEGAESEGARFELPGALWMCVSIVFLPREEMLTLR